MASKKTRANLSDLQRFEVMLLRKRRAAAVRKLAKKFSKEGGASKLKGAANKAAAVAKVANAGKKK